MKKVVDNSEEEVQEVLSKENPQATMEEAFKESNIRASGVVDYLEGKVYRLEHQLRVQAEGSEHLKLIVQDFFKKLAGVMDITSLGDLNGQDYKLSLEVDSKTKEVKLIKE